MNKFLKSVDNQIFLISIIISIPAVLALIPKGFYGASDEVHIAWLYEMYETIKLGQIPPRFVPDLSFGHGYPLFNFVFPLPYYIGTLFHYIGFSLVDSVKLLFFLSVPFSAFFMYKLLRQFSNTFLSLVGTILYIYSPYRSTDIYVRGAIGEVFSFVFLPLILLSFVKITNKENSEEIKVGWIGIAGLSIAFLILSHNITSYMFLPIALIFALFRLSGLKWSRVSINAVFVAVLLGLLGSCYFWIPAILESSLMKYSTVFDFWDHFPTLRQLVTPYFGYGASVPGPGDGISFFMGLANLAVLVLTTSVFLFKYKKLEKSDKSILVWSYLVVFISIFMMNYRSTFLWKTIPFMPYFQFPWRFLTLVSFTTPLLVISLKYFRTEKFIATILIILVFLSFPYFRPQDFLGRTDEYYLAKYIPYPEIKAEYYTQQEEYLRLPKSVEEKPTLRSGIHTLQKEGFGGIFNPKEGRLGMEAVVYSTSDTVLSYGKYYFPGWTVYDNGKKIKAFGSQPFGEVTFVLKGKGDHNVKIYFRETSFRLALNVVSLLSIIFCLFLIFKNRLVNSKIKTKI